MMLYIFREALLYPSGLFEIEEVMFYSILFVLVLYFIGLIGFQFSVDSFYTPNAMKLNNACVLKLSCFQNSRKFKQQETSSIRSPYTGIKRGSSQEKRMKGSHAKRPFRKKEISSLARKAPRGSEDRPEDSVERSIYFLVKILAIFKRTDVSPSCIEKR